ncbi:hypothetical protein glysoja_029499 [Glycine soja]|uniref:Uncharacterized protein n=1 Tax=Glycine soja TaxID=3848 RepID=A0A0B2QG23_GLYSO|nr:hypothetical protein glysoja_029499 [Glycine soja]
MLGARSNSQENAVRITCCLWRNRTGQTQTIFKMGQVFVANQFGHKIGSGQYDDSRSQELLERKIKNAPKGRGSVKMSHERSGRSIEKSGPGLRLSPRLPTLIPK